MRDVLQNHLTELMALVAMDLPSSCKLADCLSSSGRKAVLESIVKPHKAAVTLGQYKQYATHVIADRSNKGDLSTSKVPTFAVVELAIDSPRWKGTTFTMVAGKALSKREAYVKVTFREGVDSGLRTVLFNIQGGEWGENVIVTVGSKSPAPMDKWSLSSKGGAYVQKPEASVPTPPAYEVVIKGGIDGDASLFVDTSELILLWKVCSTTLSLSLTVLNQIWSPVLSEIEGVTPRIYKEGSTVEDVLASKE